MYNEKLNPTQNAILAAIMSEMESGNLRFTQILHNLDVNQFAHPTDPAQCNHQLRDNYNDRDTEVLGRITHALQKRG